MTYQNDSLLAEIEQIKKREQSLGEAIETFARTEAETLAAIEAMRQELLDMSAWRKSIAEKLEKL